MSHYIHGTSTDEQKRLTRLNTILLNNACLKELSLRGGEKILDVGSGLGQFSRAMARRAQSVVIGIERSEEQIAEALQQAKSAGEENWVEFRRGDARHLPLQDHEWGTFDVVFTRFVLEHVPDPLNVVRQMIRAAQKGGRLILADDDHDILRWYPPIEGLRELWQAYIQTFAASGNDPDIGRKLVTLLCEAGAKPVHSTWIFFGSCAGYEHFQVYVDNLISVLVGAKEQMLQHGFYKENNFDAVLRLLDDWRQKRDAALWYAVCWAEGIR
jgi:ubiquinone/menaquinone biosynthesis C-methylase UbiE